jgi:cbb3-type cytochrome oxidase subunit 3
MAGEHHAHDHTNSSGSWLRSRTGLVFLGFLVIAGFYLMTEHTAHVFGVLPYLLFLLCPILHLFMHGRHGNHGGQADSPMPEEQQHNGGGTR